MKTLMFLEIGMDTEKTGNAAKATVETKLLYTYEWGYAEVTKKGAIGFGTGKRPGRIENQQDSKPENAEQ